MLTGLKRLLTFRRATKQRRVAFDPMNIEGQISSREFSLLGSLAAKIDPPNVIVEIGSYRGTSSIALGLSAQRKGVRVFAIDPHTPFTGPKGGIYGPQDQAAMYSNIVNAGLGDTIAMICLPSEKVARAWSEQNVGLLWIDGDHRYESVHTDITSWLPWLTHGAIVAFHDTEMDSVQRVIDEQLLHGALSRLGSSDSIQWFARN